MTVSRQESTIRRPVLLTAISFVLAAVLLVALRSWLDRPAVEEVIAAAPAPEPEQPAPIAEPKPIIESTESAAVEEVEVVVSPPERVTVALLPARVESAEPGAAALADSIRQATLRNLLTMSNVDVIDVNAGELAAFVPPNAGSLGEDRLLYLAVGRRYDSLVVAEISGRAADQATAWTIRLQIVRANGSSSNSSFFDKNGTFRSRGDPESVGMQYAQRIAQDSYRVAERNVGADAVRNVVLDANRSERDRLQALSRLGALAFDSETTAVAIEMATRSVSAETRQRVLSLLRRNTYDPTLAQPLSYALLSDVDATVRKEAALGLGAYLSTPGSQAALDIASRNDSSGEVRLAARMAMMEFDEQQAFRHETLLDRSLTPAERLAPTTILATPDMPISMRSRPATLDATAAYAEIVGATDDPDLKLQALRLLQNESFNVGLGGRNVNPEITRALIESTEVADDRVRRSALSTMTQLTQDPEVRAVLEDVLAEEPELAAELRLAEALEPPEAGNALPPLLR